MNHKIALTNPLQIILCLRVFHVNINHIIPTDKLNSKMKSNSRSKEFVTCRSQRLESY